MNDQTEDNSDFETTTESENTTETDSENTSPYSSEREYDRADLDALHARAQAVVEDTETTHNLEFTELTNREALTLHSALCAGAMHYAEENSLDQFHVVCAAIESSEAQLADIHDPVHEALEAAYQIERNRPRRTRIREALSTPFVGLNLVFFLAIGAYVILAVILLFDLIAIQSTTLSVATALLIFLTVFIAGAFFGQHRSSPM